MIGKTSIVDIYAYAKFNSSYLPTIGANITKQSLKVDNQVVSLMIWDIAGQKDFYEIYKSYFNGANGIILVYDVTREKTFENLENWYSECVNNGIGHVPLILVGNKVDLKERVVEKIAAEKKADNLNIPYFETSAKNGEGVKNIFKAIALAVYKDYVR